MMSNAKLAVMPSRKPGFLVAMAASERWLVPCALFTACLVLFTLLSIHDRSGGALFLLVLPAWIIYASIIGAVYYTVRCVKQGIVGPFSKLAADWPGTIKSIFPVAVFIALSGLNMVGFMWMKPHLNYVIPFWADPLLADIDKALLFGNDPWVLVSGLNTPFFAWIYHTGWAAVLILTLIIAGVQPPSQKKSAIIATWFALWTIIGPLIHVLLPAGGPIFYESLGYGDRFAKLVANAQTHDVVQYLWQKYDEKGFSPGAGISAMPSMHVATTMWAVLCIHIFARRWQVWAAAFGLLIVILSVALGWHYLMDGIVAGTATLLAYWCALRLFAKQALTAHAVPA